ncbi:MAG: aminotransferase class I/II-fold pyridoxal phosphate-dependent enzyme [Candidatus Eremiobacteraeota bacterium]|nr:aminotransferase class I/II-fold pyridoxal phosphate-dependent enzyme [Candidatus Eremiobacteraeota bacterium]
MNVPKQYHIGGEGSNEIAASIERGVQEGRLPPGTRLPTVRALARTLRKSHGTVAAAYKSLAIRGVVVADGRRGTVVRPAPPLARALETPRVPPELRNLSDGNPDPARLPRFSQALRAVPREPIVYGNDPHDPELLEAMARSFKADGVGWSALAVVGGALDGIERALGAQLRAGDRVAVEDPIYPAHLDLLAATGLVAEPVPVDSRGMLPDALERALRRGAKAAIVSPRAHNPTGAAFDERRARELRAVLERAAELFVIEDDHAWLVAGVPYRTLTAGRERWFAVRSFSKAFGPDLRIAVAGGDPLTIARLRGRQRVGVGWVSHVLQFVAKTLFADARVLAGIEETRDLYGRRRETFVSALRAEGVTIEVPSGLNSWIPVPSEARAIERLRATGYAVAPGERFRIRTAPAIRVTVARLETGDAREVARAVAAASLRPTSVRTG